MTFEFPPISPDVRLGPRVGSETNNDPKTAAVRRGHQVLDSVNEMRVLTFALTSHTCAIF